MLIVSRLRFLLLVFAVTVTSQRAAEAREFPADWYVGTEAQQSAYAALEGKPHPELDLSDWRNSELSAGDLQGKVMLIDFWATWCAPCIADIPKKNALHEQYADQDFVFLGICGSPHGQDKYDQIIDRHGLTYPSARDASHRTVEAWGVAFMPTYALIDRNGVVRALGLHPDRIEDAVKSILEEQPAE
ncbi:MAG: TlpA disulfide reductase family protein [Planctomycetota bacterium]